MPDDTKKKPQSETAQPSQQQRDVTKGKQTIDQENHDQNVGQRPTRDDGDNDDKGELK